MWNVCWRCWGEDRACRRVRYLRYFSAREGVCGFRDYWNFDFGNFSTWVYFGGLVFFWRFFVLGWIWWYTDIFFRRFVCVCVWVYTCCVCVYVCERGRVREREIGLFSIMCGRNCVRRLGVGEVFVFDDWVNVVRVGN